MSNVFYRDPTTGRTYPLDRPRWRSDDGHPLLISAQPGISRADIDPSSPGLWRYRAALPVAVDHAITLGEGRTPLIERGGTRYKAEWFSPSGSFKDRGSTVMLSILRQQGIDAVLEDSSGNGGSSIATYGAAGGMSVTIFAPSATSPSKIAQARAMGASVVLVPGAREASQEAAIAESGAAFYASHNWQAFFVEGVKTLAYELWEDCDFEAPGDVVIPVGAGSSLLGCWLGFAELQRAGQIDTMPRLWAVQPRNCSPLDAAAHGEAREVSPTIAEGTSIRAPRRLPEMLRAIRHSGGGAVAVTETQIVAALASLADRGLFVEPTSAVAEAGFMALTAAGRVDPARTVVMLSGSGLKAAARVADLIADYRGESRERYGSAGS